MCPFSSSRRQIGAPAFALISFTIPASRSLSYRLLGLGALRTCRRNQAMIVALRRSAQQHKLCVVEFDGHDLNARVSGAGQSRPLTDASHGSKRLSGRRVLPQRLSTCGRPHTCSFSDRKPVLSSSASAVIKESSYNIGQSSARSRAAQINVRDRVTSRTSTVGLGRQYHESSVHSCAHGRRSTRRTD